MATVPHRTIRSIALEKGTKPDQRTDFDNAFDPVTGTPRGYGVQRANPMQDTGGEPDLVQEAPSFAITPGGT